MPRTLAPGARPPRSRIQPKLTVTSEPRFTFSPAAGLCTDATTAPSRNAGTFDATLKPSASSCSRAWATVWPVMTFGNLDDVGTLRRGQRERVTGADRICRGRCRDHVVERHLIAEFGLRVADRQVRTRDRGLGVADREPDDVGDGSHRDDEGELCELGDLRADGIAVGIEHRDDRAGGDVSRELLRALLRDREVGERRARVGLGLTDHVGHGEDTRTERDEQRDGRAAPRLRAAVGIGARHLAARHHRVVPFAGFDREPGLFEHVPRIVG